MGTSSGLYVLINIEEKTIYWRLLCLAAFVYLIGWCINRSRLGFALRIIGNDEEVAKHSGINVALVKILLFMISGSIAALTGALLAPRWTYTNPPLRSAQCRFCNYGSVGRPTSLGANTWCYSFRTVWDLITAHPQPNSSMLGVAFLLVVYAIPNGIGGQGAKYWAKFKHWRDFRVT